MRAATQLSCFLSKLVLFRRLTSKLCFETTTFLYPEPPAHLVYLENVIAPSRPLMATASNCHKQSTLCCRVLRQECRKSQCTRSCLSEKRPKFMCVHPTISRWGPPKSHLSSQKHTCKRSWRLKPIVPLPPYSSEPQQLPLLDANTRLPHSLRPPTLQEEESTFPRNSQATASRMNTHYCSTPDAAHFLL